MRAALLPTPGNPEMLAYWLRNFLPCLEYVDELLILVNGTRDFDVFQVPEHMRMGKVRWVTMPMRVGHDNAIGWLLENTEADHVLLCEDDAYVRRPHEIDRAFDALESGRTDIVGSPRHEDYADSPLSDNWPRFPTDDKTELRRGLWPAFLFARRADLLETDRVFSDRRWNVGEKVDGWRTVTPEDAAYVGIAPDYIHLDTLFGTTFQLRAQGLRIGLVHHVRLFDVTATEQWIVEDPPWFHVTGLSTLDQLDWPLDQLPDYAPGGGLWTRRLAWWRRVGIDIEPFLARADVDRDELRRWDERFEAWVPTAVPA